MPSITIDRTEQSTEHPHWCSPGLCEADIDRDGHGTVYHLGRPTRWVAGDHVFELAPYRIDEIGPWGRERIHKAQLSVTSTVAPDWHVTAVLSRAEAEQLIERLVALPL